MVGCDARLVIDDTGVGISATDLPLIFDRFFRADRTRNTPGTGLGLPIVKRVFESHGGTVSGLSRIGEGTTITMTLPSES
ncbi:MAG: HAMP domain-containing histidine kinase [bacterium]|nr:HAMP domain-containing histidine kinase [Candidatus Kapabacteria bacterium]